MVSDFNPILGEIAGSDWICPQPMKWNALYQMLPDTKRVGHASEPPAPLILAAWWEASDEAKKNRFLEHLKWAEDHGCMAEVLSFLRGLRHEDWYSG